MVYLNDHLQILELNLFEVFIIMNPMASINETIRNLNGGVSVPKEIGNLG